MTSRIIHHRSISIWGFSDSCPNFRFKEKIENQRIECSFGICNIFDSYISPRNNQVYIIFSNILGTSTYIYIYSVKNNNIYKRLSPCIHQKELRMLKYFINKDKSKEYIISTDCDGVLCIWSVINNFVLQQRINVYNQKDIFNCILLFKNEVKFNLIDDCIVFGCESISDDESTCAKVYSLNKGNFIKNINGTNNERIRDVLLWENKKTKEHFLICLAKDKIILINFVQNVKEKDIITQDRNLFNCGMIYDEIDKEGNEYSYLLCTSSTGHIIIVELYEGQVTCDIKLKNNIHRVYDILPWDERYIIFADCLDNGILVFEYEYGGKILGISNINGLDEDDIECIRKIKHPIYGDCLLTASHKNCIKIFVYDNFELN